MENPHPGESITQQCRPGAPPVEERQPCPHSPAPSSPSGPDSCLADMDCPVCFCTYDVSRVPKELSCGHVFCAICLKLLIRNAGGTWRVMCPVCREPTPVFGGLVCTLQNPESLMSQLEQREPKADVLEPPGTAEVAGHGGEDEPHGNLTTAARRLLILLLILLILLIIILQFIYTGIMKWVLGFILGVVVIITVLLCLNPDCRMSLPRADGQPKDNEAAV